MEEQTQAVEVYYVVRHSFERGKVDPVRTVRVNPEPYSTMSAAIEDRDFRRRANYSHFVDYDIEAVEEAVA